MRGSTRAVRAAACLGLMAALAAWPPASADQFKQCHLGTEHLHKLEKKKADINGPNGDYKQDSKCCDASSWVVDEKKGTLGVYFQAKRRGKWKELILERLEDGQSKTWSTYTRIKLFPEDYQFSGDEPSLNTSRCVDYVQQKFGYHEFQYISSGRYRLKSCELASRKRNLTWERNIRTAFDIKNLNCWATQSVYDGEWSTENRTVNVIIPFRNPVTFQNDRIYKLLDSNMTEVSVWTIRAREKDSDSLICETNDSRVYYKPESDSRIHEQRFMIKNLLSGNYTLIVESLFNPLSVLGTKINVCEELKIIYIDVSPKQPSSSLILSREERPVTIFAILLVAVVALSSFCYLMHLVWNYLHYHVVDEVKCDIVEKDSTRKKVLLLYARDCVQFNDLMATFRGLLKNNNFEVYDCQDPQLGRRLHRGPTTWLRDRLDDCSVRLLVVSTKCARLRQSALLGDGQVSYRRPHHLDPLFLYGLRGVQDVHTDVYTRIFSVALEGFTEKEDMLSLFCGSRVYSLPTHLLELYRDLRREPHIPEETKELREEIATLQNKLDILVRQKQADKHYLSKNILTCQDA
ncbi:uncharacterized protein LOC134528196 [Bacillus rossius redtenbacheri]|uniref:uncharacterized protein LOC134528196 n=1 Tax=Bacillus rossius redtenbacheri TaxID=93214 RepID=UPI002FDE0EC7